MTACSRHILVACSKMDFLVYARNIPFSSRHLGKRERGSLTA